MKRFLLTAMVVCSLSCIHNYAPLTYKGTEWKTQNIPGKIECEFYDKGGESIAYHDADSINNGSGKLNPANGNFFNEFRMKEGADISYTKSGGIDDNFFSKTKPELNQLYLGWTEPGEWVNYTVKVNKSGLYNIAAIYTCNGGGAIAFDVDGKAVTGSLKIISTHDDADTVAWRQWHHWNKTNSLTSINLTKGIHVLTLHIVEHGQMNFDYFEFY
jgi:hypothetical protein